MRADSWAFRLLEFYGTRCHHPGQWRVLAHLRRRLNLDVDAELEVVRAGHRWQLNPSDFVQSQFFWLGSYDAWDVFHLRRLLRPGWLIFDVGANFGHYAITLAEALHRQCEVHAFEPFPPNLERLRTNIRLNALEDVIRVHAVGLSDTAGSGRMATRPDNFGAATLHASRDEGHEVALTTLDAFCARHGIMGIDFMKVDVEGHEERLLRGGDGTIRRFAPLIMIEFDPVRLGRGGSSVERLAGRLDELGYDLRVAYRDTLRPLRRLPTGDDVVNVFAFHRTRHAPPP